MTATIVANEALLAPVGHATAIGMTASEEIGIETIEHLAVAT